MQLKITTDYAIRMLKYLACKGGVIQSKEVAEQMGIPVKYLINLGGRLKEGGLINTHQGKYGGYTLAKAPEDILIYEVMCVMDDPINVIPYSKEKKQSDITIKDRQISKFYKQTQDRLLQVFAEQTIADLRDGQV